MSKNTSTYEERTVVHTCGHISVQNINTAMPKALIEKMISTAENRPCIHCAAGHPERGQVATN